jgi:DNA/RNA-binding domain of Phe-tRNA-synthetase-like protein
MTQVAIAPFSTNDSIKARVRDLLRYGGYKPTGRGKPASEYLVRAATEGTFRSINQAVDTCNVVSLHSGLPISVVDLDRVRPPFRVGLADADASYVFNPAGQVIRVGGLLCLHDAEGPCANAVKDAQRTKTSDETIRTLTLIWGTNDLPDRTRQSLAWYLELLHQLGATTNVVDLEATIIKSCYAASPENGAVFKPCVAEDCVT